jgi:hypothetical protein
MTHLYLRTCSTSILIVSPGPDMAFITAAMALSIAASLSASCVRFTAAPLLTVLLPAYRSYQHFLKILIASACIYQIISHIICTQATSVRAKELLLMLSAAPLYLSRARYRARKRALSRARKLSVSAGNSSVSKSCCPQYEEQVVRRRTKW